MTTSAATAKAGSPTPAAPAPAPATDLAALPIQPPVSDTPRRLRRYQLVTAVAVLLLGLIGVGQLTQLRTELSAAPGVGVQHVRLGELSGAISSAGNQAAAAQLTGSTDDQSAPLLATAAEALVDAASAEPARADAIAAINADLLRYSQLLSAGQFDQAEQLRTSSLQPAIETLEQELTGADSHSVWWTSPFLSLGLGLLVLVALGWLSYQVAQRSHRVLNSGLLAAIVATVAIAGLSAGGAVLSGGAGRSDDSVVQGSSQLTSAQLAADSASRTLLDATRHKRWDKAAQTALSGADQKAAAGFGDSTGQVYASLQDARKPVVTALAAGNWAKAGSELGRTASVEEKLSAAIADERAGLSAGTTSDARTDSLLFLCELGIAILGLGGAFLGARGLQTRIEEYR